MALGAVAAPDVAVALQRPDAAPEQDAARALRPDAVVALLADAVRLQLSRPCCAVSLASRPMDGCAPDRARRRRLQLRRSQHLVGKTLKADAAQAAAVAQRQRGQ